MDRQMLLETLVGRAKDRMASGPARAYQRPGQGTKEQADRYATRRINQFRSIADLLGGDFGSLVNETKWDEADPSAVYRAMSAAFSQASQQQGIADPRVLLQQLLMAQQGRGPYRVGGRMGRPPITDNGSDGQGWLPENPRPQRPVNRNYLPV